MPKKKNDVGYKKPPKGTQFIPGKSGNEKGRPPKKRVTAATILQDVFLGEVEVQKNGRKQKMPRLGVLANQILSDAMQGDKRAIEHVVKLLPYLDRGLTADTGSEHHEQFDKDRDIELLKEFARLAGFDPETQFVGDFGLPENGDDNA